MAAAIKSRLAGTVPEAAAYLAAKSLVASKVAAVNAVSNFLEADEIAMPVTLAEVNLKLLPFIYEELVLTRVIRPVKTISLSEPLKMSSLNLLIKNPP